MQKEKQIILSDLKQKLSEHLKDELKALVLFGSQLTDNATPESDYDILIILKQNPDWVTKREISDICYEIELQYGILTDTLLISETEINTLRGKQPIFHNALSQGYYA